MYKLNITIEVDPEEIDLDNVVEMSESLTLEYYNYSRDKLIFDAGRILASRFDVLAIDLIDLDTHETSTLFDIELDDLEDLEP